MEEDKVLRITKDNQYDYIVRLLDDDTYEIVRYLGNDVDITVPKNIDEKRVSRIGAAAFAGCKMKSIVVPGTVESIQDIAFMKCEYLENVIFEEGVKTIGNSIFYYSANLVNVSLPDSLESIEETYSIGGKNLNYNIYGNGKYVGNNNNPYILLCKTTDKDIKECKVADGCKFIGNAPFPLRWVLKEVWLPDSVISINKDAFVGNRNVIVYAKNEYVYKYCEEHDLTYKKYVEKYVMNNGLEELKTTYMNLFDIIKEKEEMKKNAPNTVAEYLKNEKEEMPKWLNDYKPGDKLDFDEILKHRVVFYPGSYMDGQPIRTFNKAGYAHTFMYVDYILSKNSLLYELYKNECFRGYKLVDCREVTEKELLPGGWVRHANIDESKARGEDTPYCLFTVFEREDNYDDSHGAKRFAVIFLYADGIATYDALFINKNRAPAVILIQDHGFGCNYDRFGKGGLLEKLAKKYSVLPKYIMCEKDNYWAGYEWAYTRNCEIGGMHSNKRFLFIKK